ncbi:hypothetical protein Tco_0924960 [Tanacetum coccineum]|uniref:Uncharacterized protein n=1 Tax=Tanacetum coccineum TaxID=301880 RepID=A0ABQ5D5G5_9ASTR
MQLRLSLTSYLTLLHVGQPLELKTFCSASRAGAIYQTLRRISLLQTGRRHSILVAELQLHSMGKTIKSCMAMLKLHKQTLTKNNALALHAIRAGKVQKGNNKHKKQQPQLAAWGQNQGKGKNKLAYAP